MGPHIRDPQTYVGMLGLHGTQDRPHHRGCLVEVTLPLLLLLLKVYIKQLGREKIFTVTIYK